MCVRAFGIFLHSYTTQTYIYFFSFFCCCCCSILTATAADINNSNQSNNFYCCCWRFQLLCQRPEYKHTLVDIICTNVRVFVCVCASCMLDPQHPCRHVNMTIAVFPSVHLLMLFFFICILFSSCMHIFLFVRCVLCGPTVAQTCRCRHITKPDSDCCHLVRSDKLQCILFSYSGLQPSTRRPT